MAEPDTKAGSAFLIHEGIYADCNSTARRNRPALLRRGMAGQGRRRNRRTPRHSAVDHRPDAGLIRDQCAGAGGQRQGGAGRFRGYFDRECDRLQYLQRRADSRTFRADHAAGGGKAVAEIRRAGADCGFAAAFRPRHRHRRHRPDCGGGLFPAADRLRSLQCAHRAQRRRRA